ncbi:hypothetical protein PEPNEM18_01092 [Aedoeadaptatus nemausensis]|uniref:Uncharacterized protein n=1 Tax=Aedoeadaptatus nemausensis TaxID=2582829 RepID=A0A6V6Y433_9FIRM|nr:hypothetical protein [Peptoniphilus nemausensis]CAC9931789.1 hypothetical protein PEPNEM18_01092 [Peptoniphilus nemausensis]
MSNENSWIKTLADFETIVDSARYSISMDDLFDDDMLYEPIRETVSDFDMASWLMFDTLENRETTRDLMHQFWRHLHKVRSVEYYLEPFFDSYLSIYRVNHVAEKGIYIQNIAIEEPAVVIHKTDGTKVLKEGSLFFGRILHTESGHFAFHIANMVPEDLEERFMGKIKAMMNLQPLLTQDPEGYVKSLKDGNPDLLFLYALGIEQSREDQSEELYYGWVDGEEDEGEDLLSLVARLGITREEAVEDIHVLEWMEDRLYLQSGQSMEDDDFTEYFSLIEKAAEEGIFSSDGQLLRVLDYLRIWTKAGTDRDAYRSVMKAQNQVLSLKAHLENTVHGFYRSAEFDRALSATPEDYISWIAQYDRYLECFVEYSMEATQTGALNRDSLDKIFPLIGVKISPKNRYIREGSYPELVFYRAFAELKGFIVRDGGRYVHTTQMERYLELSPHEKLSLWLSTLLHPDLEKEAPYFKEWRVGEVWTKLEEENFLSSLMKIPQPVDKKSRIEGLAVQLGQELKLYRLLYDGRYHVDLTPVGEAVFRRIGAMEKDNVVPLFEQ